MATKHLPLTLRLTGLWLIWSAWCQWCGWSLSFAHELHGWGYLAALPILFGVGWWWLKFTAAGASPRFSQLAKWRRRFSRPLPLIYFGIAALSLLAAILYSPWGFDATTYRLPRVLDWWVAQHWYWIGTLDHRLDYSG